MRKKYKQTFTKAQKKRRALIGRLWRKKYAKRISIVAKKWRARNRERVAAWARRWRHKNRAHHVKTVTAWYRKNRDKIQRRNKKWKIANAAHYKIQCAEYRRRNKQKIDRRIRRWAKLNSHRCRAAFKRRQTRVMRQLHPESDKNAMVNIYGKARIISRSTGILHVVDHVIPLHYGGWHHQLNLQVMPYTTNASKGRDPFWEADGYKSWRDIPRFLWPKGLAARYARLIPSTPLSSSL